MVQLRTESDTAPPKNDVSGSVGKTPRMSGWKRLVLVVTGWAFIAIGFAGLFLPLLPGIVFIFAGLIILSKEYHWAANLIQRLRSRFPRITQWLHKARAAAAPYTPHSGQSEPPAREDESPDN